MPSRAAFLRGSTGCGLFALLLASFATPTAAQTGPGEGREGLAELGKFDPRLKGHYAPKGFKVQVAAAEPVIVDPTAMAFADDGTLYVAEWKTADHMYDTKDTMKLPEGGTTRIMRRRKATTDVVKRLRDVNGDGVYDSSEVVVDGAEMPSAIFPWKNSLYLTCVGRLERWSDDDGDGRFETRTIIADGFCGFYHHWLSGMVLNSDGWFYLTAGDNDNHIVGSDGSRVEVSRCGGVFRGRVDGSRMHMFSMGFRNPYRNVAFNSTSDPFLVDNDNEDGSKWQGCRLVNAVEEGDYGWRLLPGAPCCQPDFDRGAVSGELPGKLPIVAKTGRGAPAGLIAYNGVAFPDPYRDLVLYPDVFRKLVRAYRARPQGGAYALERELTLMTADDDLFRPCQAVVGADGAIYVLDWRSNSGGAGRLWGDGKYGRLYRISWEGDGQSPALPLKENNWNRVLGAVDPHLMLMLRGRDHHEAVRALREVVDRAKVPANLRQVHAPVASLTSLEGEQRRRAEATRDLLLGLMNDPTASIQARLLGLQGARQLWDDATEKAMLKALDDVSPEIRRLAAQALSWEPKERRPILVPALVAHLNDADGRAVRDVALAIGQHGWAVPFDAAPPLFAWLLAHPQADVVTRDAFIRALERLGDPGVEEIAQAVRNREGADRAQAVAIFTALRTEPAAKRLPALATLPPLSAAERLALVRQFKDVPLNIPVPTQGLADWVAAHPEIDSPVKVAALDVCRLAGNPAPALVVKLLDDRDETVRIAATELAAQSRPAGAIERLTARILVPALSSRERTAIARALRIAGPAAFPALASAYNTFAADPAFRRAALRALADADRVQATPIAEAALTSGSPELKAESIQILGESPQTARRLGQAFLDAKLSPADLPAVLAAVRKYNVPDLRKMVADLEAVAKKSISAADLKALYTKGADPWKGLSVYLRETGTRCYACHKIENLGGSVGPALTGVSQALSLDKMIEAILDPSKEIKEGYESYKVALKDGRVLTGIKVSQDDKVLVLKDANGQETRIPRDQIEEQAKDSVSLMPVGLAVDVSHQDLADVLAFLLSKPAQETLRVKQKLDHFLAIGPFPLGKDGEGLPLDKVEPSKSYPGQDQQTVVWVPLDSSTAGTLKLRGQFGLTPGRAYLSAQIRSDQPQDAALRFGLDGAARLYLNGAKVAEAPGRGEAKVSTSLAHLPLKAGWNTLVVAADRAAQGDDKAIFELNSAQAVEVRTSRP